MNKEVKHKDGYYNCECPMCGKMFHRKPYQLKISKTKPCCSRECLREFKRGLMSGSGNHQYGLLGVKNPTWKGGKKKSNHGYILIRSHEHPFASKDHQVFEHRLIAERFLLNDENSIEIDGKKYLKPEYVVHHKNHVKDDNRVENLVVMKHGDHQSMHAKEQNKHRRRDELGRFIS